MSIAGQITEDKIGDLGRAIASKSDFLLEIYLSSSPVFDNKKTKHYRNLRDSGVINESDKGATLSREARYLLDNIAKKTHRRHVMPDVDVWKSQVEEYSERALNAAYELDDSEDEEGYLEAVSHLVRDLSDSLYREMADIEYIINSELSDTTNIKGKRVILTSLISRIGRQIDKLKTLSRNGLKECHAGNSKVEMILSLTLYEAVDKCIDEMQRHQTKTMALMDRLNKEHKRQNARVWRLHHSLRNNQYNPEETIFSFDDLVDLGLAAGGLDFTESLTNTDVDIESNNYFLLMTVGQISEGDSTKKVARAANMYSGHVQQDDGEDEAEAETLGKEQSKTEQQEWGFSFLAYNNKHSYSENLSANEYWELFELEAIIERKAFLALILHQCKSDFLNDTIVRTADGYQWKLYIDTVKASPACATVYIKDVCYYRYKLTDGAPSREEVWTRG